MQLFSKLVLTILLAHLLGDFPLQTSKMVRGKGRGSRAYLFRELQAMIRSTNDRISDLKSALNPS
jgi:hypothetical protein